MRQSKLFNKTLKEDIAQEPSKNANLLTRAGFIHKTMAGVNTFTPLGLRTLGKIEDLIRFHMDKTGAQEVMMPLLHPRENWEKTGRWDTVDILYKLKGHGDKEYCLSPTHEEVVTPYVQSMVSSYRDFPIHVYQIQNKYRDEPRAKSGLLRGKEFRMKDLYSFHTTQADLDKYYDEVAEAYMDFYTDCGLGDNTYMTFASGGAFSKYSHEFQTISDAGEDTVYIIPGTKTAINKEIIEDKDALRDIIPNYTEGMEDSFEVIRAAEVGNIFKLGSRFSDAFGLTPVDKDGTQQKIVMGCYGIGSSRIMGTIVECLSDDKGIVWPEKVAPYKYHLISMATNDSEAKAANAIYEQLIAAGVEVLFDDRMDVRGGAKLAEADLIGIPYQIIVGNTFAETGKLEVKNRKTGQVELKTAKELIGN